MKLTQQEHDAICRKLVDEGKLIEAGFMGYRLTMHTGAPQIQIDETRMAFFAGAHHLFSSIMGMLEPGSDATSRDLSRMNQINSELNHFLADFKKRCGL